MWHSLIKDKFKMAAKKPNAIKISSIVSPTAQVFVMCY